jgi:hypothetical protein
MCYNEPAKRVVGEYEVQKPWGHTFNLRLSLAGPWLRLGAGWAALAGVLAGGWPELSLPVTLKLAGLWLLVDPLLGTLWEIVVQQGLWRQLARADLPLPPRHGFSLPYVQPGSVAGRGVLAVRRYRRWWRESYGPTFGDKVVTALAIIALALLLGLSLNGAVFWLALLTIALTLLAGFASSDLTTSYGGRLQTVGQFFLPWAMGMVLFGPPLWAALLPALLYGAVFLGGLRMLGQHRRAEWLFFGGQFAALMVLAGGQHLPGAALVGVLLAAQGLLKSTITAPEQALAAMQPCLLGGMLAVAISLGSGGY